tara:strand:+ start:65 stop:499 length:435 start_codon:yes stop_codon:yes gene_type:complete
MKNKIVKLSQLQDTLSEGDMELDLDNGDYIKYNIFGPFLKGYKQQYGNWNELEKSLRKGYNPKKHPRGFITVAEIWFTDKYLVYDGSHRVRTLTKMYGGDHQIEVKVMSKLNVITQASFLIIALLIVIPCVTVMSIWRKIKGEK